MRKLFPITKAFILIAILFSAQAFASDYPFRDTARKLGLQGRQLWVTGVHNLKWLNDRDKVRDFCQKASKAGFNELAIEVKAISGEVLYDSNIAPKVKEWNNWTLPRDYDALQVLIEEAHAVGLAVTAAFNVLTEGHKYRPGIGLAWNNKNWQMVSYEISRRFITPNTNLYVQRLNAMPSSDGLAVYTQGVVNPPPKDKENSLLYLSIDADLRITGITNGYFITEPLLVSDNGFILVADGAAAEALSLSKPGMQCQFDGEPVFLPIELADSEPVGIFVTPLNAEVRKREIELICEVATKYNVDGIALDRMRHSGIETDFSDYARKAFEYRLGRSVRWPQDVFEQNPIPGKGIKQGPLFGKWMEFRASVIKDFARDVEKAIRNIKPHLPIGVYVGSWYDVYYDVGVNWADDAFPAPYEWAANTYRFNGYANHMDFISTGCYQKIPTIEDAPLFDAEEGSTVEAFARRSMRVAGNGSFVYASINLFEFPSSPADALRAAKVCLDTSCGVMVFDSIYIYDRDWWSHFEDFFKTPTPKAPHQLPGLLKSLRDLRDMGMEGID